MNYSPVARIGASAMLGAQEDRMREIHALHVQTARLALKDSAPLAKWVRPVLWTAATLFGGGCSPDDPSSSWVGLYEVQGEQLTVCGASSKTAPLGGSANIGYGASSGVFQISIDACPLQWNATDTTATLVADQSCNLSVDGAMAAVTFASGTATNDSVVVKMDFEGLAENGCKVTQQASLTYVPIRWCKKVICGYVYPNAG
jgi:hypothetical protein